MLSDTVPASWSATQKPRRHRGSSSSIPPAQETYQSVSSQQDYGYQSAYTSEPSTDVPPLLIKLKSPPRFPLSREAMITGTCLTQKQWYYQSQSGTGSYTTMSPTYSSIPYNSQQHSSVPSPYPDYGASAGGGVVYAGQMVTSTPVYVPASQPVLSYMPIPSYNEAPTYPDTGPSSPTSMAGSTHYASSSKYAMGSMGEEVIQTEARKIIITSLPHATTGADLRDFLLASAQGIVILGLEIAKHGDGASRGHAFVTLETHAVAKGAFRFFLPSSFFPLLSSFFSRCCGREVPGFHLYSCFHCATWEIRAGVYFVWLSLTRKTSQR